MEETTEKTGPQPEAQAAFLPAAPAAAPAKTPAAQQKITRVVILCEVIDNYGDAGVCLRLARDLTCYGCLVKIYCNVPERLLALTAPEDRANQALQVLPWPEHGAGFSYEAPDLLIEAFACRPPAPMLQAMHHQPPGLIVVIDYLSAEPWVQECHLHPTFSDNLPGFFFYPGFTPQTGGLIIEDRWRRLLSAPAQSENLSVDRPADRRIDRTIYKRSDSHSESLDELKPDAGSLPDYRPNCTAKPETPPLGPFSSKENSFVLKASIFSYDCPQAAALLCALAKDVPELQATAFVGMPEESLLRHLPRLKVPSSLHLKTQPMVDQLAYDKLLLSHDLNLVRGEDSVVRAMLAGRPWLWQIYQQEDELHLVKLRALFAVMKQVLPEHTEKITNWEALNLWYAGAPSLNLPTLKGISHLFEFWPSWQQAALLWGQYLLKQPSLTLKLLEFAQNHISSKP